MSCCDKLLGIRLFMFEGTVVHMKAPLPSSLSQDWNTGSEDLTSSGSWEVCPVPPCWMALQFLLGHFRDKDPTCTVTWACSSDCRQILLWNHCLQQQQPLLLFWAPCWYTKAVLALFSWPSIILVSLSVFRFNHLSQNGGPGLEVLFQMQQTLRCCDSCLSSCSLGWRGAVVPIKAPGCLHRKCVRLMLSLHPRFFF